VTAGTRRGRLTHLDVRGRARMVDVGEKPETARLAVASAVIRMSLDTLDKVTGGAMGKGDVLGTARVAGYAALKRTADLIPLCHPVRVVGSAVELAPDRGLPGVRVRVTVRAFDRTGVEMEALVGAAAAALTIYDMVKGVERGVEILSLRLDEKRGGRTGPWRRDAESLRATSEKKTKGSSSGKLAGKRSPGSPARKKE
jgi:cyclic pyranopterin monophosphate synthase